MTNIGLVLKMAGGCFAIALIVNIFISAPASATSSTGLSELSGGGITLDRPVFSH